MARLVGGVLIVVAIALGFGSGASAGGWAVTTLDAVPTPVAGEQVAVGFTILQHGVTPVDLTEGVAIEVTAADGASTVFPAHLEGATGHYVATVVFPVSGTYHWSVQQGWFEPQSLGMLTVADPSAAAASAGGGGSSSVSWLGSILAVLAGLFALGALVDLVRTTRRRRQRRSALA